MQENSIHPDFIKELDEELQNLIITGIEEFNLEVFNRLALKEFRIQYESIKPLREYCQVRGISPETVKTWEEIPALTSQVFKDNVIATFPLHETELVTMTSGTSNPNAPSKIYRDKKSVETLYMANEIMTRSFLFPDVDRMKILLMVPSPKIAPAMGMAIGLEHMRQNFGTEDSIYLITPNGMEWELLFSALNHAVESGEPVAIVGATSGFVYFFNFCREQGLRFQLPPGSRICDGGGYLGTFGDCTREEYLSLCQEFLGVPPEYCVNTLGSAESGTNYFDNVLRNHYLGISGVPRYKVSPPWARTIVVDSVSGKRLPQGEIGLLCHYDLVNRANIFALGTGNLGYETEDGFEIIGRNDAKGKGNFNFSDMQNEKCSTVADNMLAAFSGKCSTVADEMLTAQEQVCSTASDQLLAQSPHGDMFKGMSSERFEKLKKMCPFLKLQGLLKKSK
ncbi:MAG: acyl-protein synthetase [Clostridia bacterium]|nr:acyl-protein synthetase [Clostridia bacterium]